MHSERQNELEEKIGAGSKNTDDIFDLAEIYFYKGMFVQMLNLLETLDDIPLREIDQIHLCQQKAEALRSLGRFEDFEYQYKKSIDIPAIP